MNVMEMFSLRGKVALLTGGAGFYGAQIAEALSEAGAAVYIASRNQEKLQAVAARYPDMHALPLDLSSEDSVKAVVTEIVRQSGRLDILVNNAVTRSACSSWKLGMDDFDASLRVNASALFILTREAAEEMKKHHGGSVINIASYMGVRGLNMTNYTGTDMYPDDFPSPAYFYEKGGMVNFTRFAATALGKFGIRVNCLLPGGLSLSGEETVFTRNYSANTPLGRMAGKEDLKGAIVFMASAASAYITGALLPVDGGYIAK